ncbi:MAG: YIP1 family protein [Clostridia bacterium]|nr:YIP1 family protein [Clostridia bacterium]
MKNSKSSMLRRCLAVVVMVLVLVSCFATSASALEVQNEPYDTYTIWTGYGSTITASQRPVYEYLTTVNGHSLNISSLKEPGDICTDTAGNVYITDSSNGRIVVLNPDFTLKREIKNLTYQGEAIDITGSLGAYAHTDGKLYIADTQHARVVVCTPEGVVEDLLVLPEADVIPSDFQFMPKRIAIDSKGYKYIVSEGSYYGAILYGPDNEFLSFYGSNTVTASLTDAFKRLVDMLFSSDVKQQNDLKSLPFQFTDIAVDDKDFIYTATGASNIYKADPGQLKKLSPGGVNVLKDKTGKVVTSSNSLQFSDAYRSIRAASSTNRVSSIATLTIDKRGFMYAADETYGRVYIYDQNCNPIAVFGGGTGSATQKGMSSVVSSMALGKNGEVILLDRVTGCIQIYKITEYGKLLLDAQELTITGAYVEAQPLWDEVLKLDRNCQLAYRGLAKAALINKDYDLACEYAKIGLDQDTYASAFEYVRADIITENFTVMIIVAVVLIAGVAALIYVSRKKQIVLVRNKQVKLMFSSILHPFQIFNKIRYEGEGSIMLACIILVFFYVGTFIKSVYGGFMYHIFDKTTFNSFIVLLGSVGLVILWVVCNWGMSTLFEGKGKAKHIFIVTCYSLIPYTAYLFIYTLLSNFVVPDEALILTVIYYVCFGLTAIMFCIGIMTVHEFGFGKFVGITAISVVAMLVVVFIIFMVSILVQQFGSFFVTVYNEVKYR